MSESSLYTKSEQEEKIVRMIIVGQVTHAGRVYEPVANLTLKLVEVKAPVPVMSTSTDSFGEFDFMSLEEATYGIRLGASNDAPTVLVWDNGQC